MKKFLTLLLLLALPISFALSGCGNETKTPDAPAKVSLGLLRLTSSAPLFLAMEKGYFREVGIEIEPVWFDAAQPIAVAAASSDIDVGATGITAGLYNMAAKGQAIRLVADKGREQKGFPSSALLASTAPGAPASIDDLRGKRIGLTQRGSTYEYMLGRLLETRGLSLDDVTLVPLGKLSAVIAALESRQIDACILNEPNVTHVQKSGSGRLITQIGDIIPYQTSAVFYSPKFQKRKDIADRFLTAYQRACRAYYKAVVEKEDPETLATLVAVIAKYTNAPEDDIRAALPYIDKDGNLLTSDIETQIKWYRTHGLLEGNLTAADVVGGR